eukprot:760348-Hanusia_phi.AAC.7
MLEPLPGSPPMRTADLYKDFTGDLPQLLSSPFVELVGHGEEEARTDPAAGEDDEREADGDRKSRTSSPCHFSPRKIQRNSQGSPHDGVKPHRLLERWEDFSRSELSKAGKALVELAEEHQLLHRPSVRLNVP